MVYPKIYYKEPIYRPPSEASSLLIQATEGCTFHCTFCVSNLGKPFKIRKIEDIKKDLDAARMIYGKGIRRIFLLDGNAFVMRPSMLIEICKYAYSLFPNLERISAYAHVKDILRKTDEELKQIREAGLKMVYVGIETGYDKLLKEIKKQTTSDEIIKAIKKLHKANITLSATIILGLAGSDENESAMHAKKTAELINAIAPEDKRIWYISALTLIIPPGTPLYKAYKEGKFKEASIMQILKELEILLSNINNTINNCIFRSNHASNYLPLKGVLAKDKKKLIEIVRYIREHPQSLPPKFYRAL